ncbi:MAG: exodeoxyribonuclease VII large subunit [Muribaculaceae bacterium]|nr:exodeoxyribonuclease VII large subunit [Muribaculaceae bacterium]
MPSLFDNQTEEALTLSAFNARIKNTLNKQLDLQHQWVQAETSDVAVRRGHCYLELIEKNPENGATIARAQAVVWASIFGSLNAQFKSVTGQDFASGMKVLVCVSATFHEQYGLKLLVHNINPEFTLGDMARQRREILDRLARDGVIDMNKNLPWPLVPQRIAVISAVGAAGYGDFINQLEHNAYGLQYYPCLFTATMQGVSTVPSVLAALDRVNAHIEHFDCVVVIRGGGSTSDLNSFDNYDLAAAIAQFPIPVIVGIGHERDVTVLDYVAAMRVKTPTAAAEWLIQRGSDALAHLTDLSNTVVSNVRDMLAHSREQLAYYGSLIPATARRVVDTSRVRLEGYARAIPLALAGRLTAERTCLQHHSDRLREAATQHMLREHMRIDALHDKVELLSPRNILNRGYSLTMCAGRYLTRADQLKPGDAITVHLSQGKAKATVLNIQQ